jgi:hypothetical protein
MDLYGAAQLQEDHASIHGAKPEQAILEVGEMIKAVGTSAAGSSNSSHLYSQRFQFPQGCRPFHAVALAIPPEESLSFLRKWAASSLPTANAAPA